MIPAFLLAGIVAYPFYALFGTMVGAIVAVIAFLFLQDLRSRL